MNHVYNTQECTWPVCTSPVCTLHFLPVMIVSLKRTSRCVSAPGCPRVLLLMRRDGQSTEVCLPHLPPWLLKCFHICISAEQIPRFFFFIPTPKINPPPPPTHHHLSHVQTCSPPPLLVMKGLSRDKCCYNPASRSYKHNPPFLPLSRSFALSLTHTPLSLFLSLTLSVSHTLSLSLSVLGIAAFGCLQQCRGSWIHRHEHEGGKTERVYCAILSLLSSDIWMTVYMQNNYLLNGWISTTVHKMISEALCGGELDKARCTYCCNNTVISQGGTNASSHMRSWFWWFTLKQWANSPSKEMTMCRWVTGSLQCRKTL